MLILDLFWSEQPAADGLVETRTLRPATVKRGDVSECK